MEFYYLDPEDIRYLHDEMIEEYGGIYGENESGMIDYMADKPKQYLFEQEIYPDLFQKAAVYLEGFATHQYFCDGNKRTGVKCCLTFLLINGYELIVEDYDLYKITLEVANKRMDIDEITQWLESNCVKNFSGI
ncbi:type II toxin-antitoxin system death-on-curing family toxin [Robertmurraya siralis]|uniref:type II toxin-antitoxin system death-on-curing family toxin n=1 Tax=Robertmurraya siralis TaxID=77777 RepID=UPI0010F6D5FB|nr:type II toxin-antitoxin system death-on-curing family toxin [Robertmurraya siralis]